MPDVQCKYVVVVLAAGESRRFGEPKQLALIHGIPMLRHQLLNLQAPGAYDLVVVLQPNSAKIRATINDLDVTIVENPGWQDGMASSIKTGISKVRSGFPAAGAMIIVLGDQWKLTREHLGHLIESSESHPDHIIATNYDGSPGAPACFPRQAWSLLDSLRGDEGSKQVLRSRNDVLLVDIPEARMDMDYPEDRD